LFLDLISRCRKSNYLDSQDISAVFGYAAYRSFFKKNKTIVPVVISDISPNLAIIAAAAEEAQGIFWWQDDYHYNTLPSFKLAGASVLTDAAIRMVFDSNSKASVDLRGDGSTYHQIRLPMANTQKVAVAVNGFFSGCSEQLAALDSLRSFFGLESIFLRLHPTALFTEDFPGWINVTSPNEQIQDFAQKYDLIFVGNSAIQLRLVISGGAVCHIKGLDPQEYDLYGYVTKGVVYGISRIANFSWGDLRGVYTDPDYYNKLSHVVGDD
jgi:hypothetical protein